MKSGSRVIPLLASIWIWAASGCSNSAPEMGTIAVTRAEYDSCGDAPRLAVEGSVQVESSAEDVSVAYAAPQGFNPAILILDVTVTRAASAVQQPQAKAFSYQLPLDAPIYTQVHVRYGDDSDIRDISQRDCSR